MMTFNTTFNNAKVLVVLAIVYHVEVVDLSDHRGLLRRHAGCGRVVRHWGFTVLDFFIVRVFY
jgi:hypothetical protein